MPVILEARHLALHDMGRTLEPSPVAWETAGFPASPRRGRSWAP